MPSRIVDDLASEALGKPQRVVQLTDPQCLAADPVLSACAREIQREMREPAAPSRLRMDVLAQDVAVHLVRRHAGLRLPSIARVVPRAKDWRLRRVLEALEADLANDAGLEELAALVGLSPRRLTMLFRAGSAWVPTAG